LAEAAGINVIGPLGLLLEAKRARTITAVRPELDKLLKTSFFLGRQLYDQVLRQAGELES
jgi:predicted nucleic acid-binding protein